MITNQVCGGGCVCVYIMYVCIYVCPHMGAHRGQRKVLSFPLLSLSAHSLEGESFPEYEACVLDFD